MADESPYCAARLSDRAQIQDRLLLWARAVDRREWSLVREVFHTDGYDNHGLYQCGIDGLISWLDERHHTITQSTHAISNMLIEFSGSDRALVESCCVVYQRYADAADKTSADITGGRASGTGAFDMLINGRYIDQFERRQADWRIAHRTTVFDKLMVFPVPEVEPEFGSNWARGQRNDDDPLWGLRKRAGLKNLSAAAR